MRGAIQWRIEGASDERIGGEEENIMRKPHFQRFYKWCKRCSQCVGYYIIILASQRVKYIILSKQGSVRSCAHGRPEGA